MVMTTGGANFNNYSLEHAGIDDYFRASPEPGSYYRCPVSTPLHGKNRGQQQKIPESVTFVSLDFSQVKSSPKQNVYRGMPAGKKVVPRRKNMDYYYVDKSFQKRIARQSNTTWLRGLCAQPVEEIFTKYRKQSELQRQNTIMTRSYSTPGEKAILEGWESNSSHRRLNSATSRSSIQSLTTQETETPSLQVVSKAYRQSDGDVTRTSSRVDANPHLTTPGDTPRESGSVFNNSSSRLRQNVNLRENTSCRLNISPVVDDQFYDQFKRQSTKLPDIHRKSYSFQSRQRKYYSSPNLFASPREPSPTFTGGLAPAQKLETSGALNCSLCSWDETPRS